MDGTSETSVDRGSIGISSITVRVSGSVSIGVSSSISSIGNRSMDGTTSSGVSSLGSNYSRFVNRDHGTVGMSDKSSEVTSVSVRISSSVSVSKDTLQIDNTSSVSVSKLGSSNSRCVSRDYSAIVVSYKLGTGYSHQGRENQELHIRMCVLR